MEEFVEEKLVERLTDRLAGARDRIVELRTRLRTVKAERDALRKSVDFAHQLLAETQKLAAAREEVLLKALERLRNP